MSATTTAERLLDIREAGARPRLRTRLGTADRGAVRLAFCATPTLAMILFWSTNDGGYDTTSWLEGAIALVALAGWSRLVFGPSRPLGRHGRAALLALGLFVAWSYASVLWAVDKGTALTGSHRVLLYLALFLLFAGLDWSARRLELALLFYLLGVGVLALVVLIELALGPAPQLLQDGQLAAGLGYHNATAALGTIGALASILLGSSARRALLTRVALAVSATACLEVALLAQSRGWLYTLPVIVLIAVAVAPSRGRVLTWSAVPLTGVLATLPWALHGPGVPGARAGLAATLLSGAAGVLVARFQQRFTLSARGRRMTRAAGRAVAAVMLVAAASTAVIAVGTGAAARGWHQFTHDAPVASSGAQRFAQLGSGRYDFWRVALHSFTAHPLGGLGQDNFAQSYVAVRRTAEEPAWVHSLELRLLAHTGLIGFALFVGFLVFAVGAYRVALRGADRRVGLVLAAALVPFVVWVVHGSFDWFWEIPALSAPTFAFLGAAVALEPGREPQATTPLRKVAAHPLVALAATAGALTLFGSAYVGERALASGRALASLHPGGALTDLRLAARLEPLSSAPQALAAGIELRGGEGRSALSVASAGLRRDPGDWVLWLEEGLAAGAAGRASLERSALAHAHALDPREPVIGLALQRADTPDPLTITEAASLLAARAHALVAP